MCTRIPAGNKLITTRKDKYVLVMKKVNKDNKIKSVCENFYWKLKKTYKDSMLSVFSYDAKQLFNEQIIDRDGFIYDGMFHVAPYTQKAFNLLDEDKYGWHDFYPKKNINIVKIFLAVIPKGSRILYGINDGCSRVLDDSISICTNQLRLIKPIDKFNNKLK